jgi:hypothetical protein
MGSHQAPQLITLTEAARRLGISRVTMSKRVKDGHFTVYTNPRDQREKLLDAAEVEAAAQPKVVKLRRDDEGKAAA